MRREEVAFAIDLAAREGWNPGLHDAECFFAADPDGFLIGELQDRAGRVHLGGLLRRTLRIRRPLHRSSRVSRPRLRAAAVASRHGSTARTQRRPGRRRRPARQLRSIRVPPRVRKCSLSRPSRTGSNARLDCAGRRSVVRGDRRPRPDDLPRATRCVPSLLARAAERRSVRRQRRRSVDRLYGGAAVPRGLEDRPLGRGRDGRLPSASTRRLPPTFRAARRSLSTSRKPTPAHSRCGRHSSSLPCSRPHGCTRARTRRSIFRSCSG